MGLGGKDVVEEEYSCTLSEQSRKVALDELREDDYVREQSLEQMREWIRKHPHIQRCHTDATFLLRFLRVKKFSVPLACDMLERYITIRQLYPHWFQNLDCEDNEISELLDSGYIVPLAEKFEGKTVIYVNADKFDPYKFTSTHMVKVTSIVTETLTMAEEDQVNGFIYVNNAKGFQLAHVSLWSLKDVRNIVRCVQNASPMRHKANHIVNLASPTKKLIEFALSVVSEKLRSRTFVHNTVADLQTKIDKKILPQEFGGEVPLKEMVEKFKFKLQKHRKQLLALDDLFIEIDENNCKLIAEMNEELGVGIEGSFKQLQVD